MRTEIVLRDDWEICRLPAQPEGVTGLLAGDAALPDVEWYKTSLPAGVHEVLLAAGEIADPHVGRNAAACQWVADEDWAFRHRFATPPGSAGGAWLTFLGVDTIAEAYLNGELIQRFDNMFREYTVPVDARLAEPGGENVLVVVVRSPARRLREVTEATRGGGIAPHHHLRKSSGDFGPYLGARPRFLKLGLHRDVVLSVRDGAWLDDLRVRTTALGEDRADLQVDATLGGTPAGALTWSLTDPDGDQVSSGRQPAADRTWSVPVPSPRRWWPRTHGRADRYTLCVTLVDDAGNPLDERSVTVGLRTIELMRTDPQTGEERFALVVNGSPIFCRGACWAPVEGITNAWVPQRALRLLDLAELADMNLLRVWGGGVVPDDSFYDECDRRGIMVWQDFMFDYGMYPGDDPEFAANVEQEATGIVRRLRNHPSIALWCGGNENHMGHDFDRGGSPDVGTDLHLDTIAEVCRSLDPDRAYHAGSPYGGPVPNWPLSGDWHDYTTITYAHRSSVPLFASEVGRVSAPNLSSMRRFLDDKELWPAGHDGSIRRPGDQSWPPAWAYHSADGAWDKIGPIEDYGEPAGAADYVRVLGTAHGEYLRRRVERQRRGRPDGASGAGRRCWGNMVWRLNDPWPVLYWSVIDSYLEPKIPYYFLRRAYTAVQVSFEQGPDELAVWIVNDSAAPVEGTLRVQRCGFTGAVGAELAVPARVGPGEAVRVVETADLGPISLRREFLRATFLDQDVTWLVGPERYLHLPEATLDVQVAGHSLTISTDNFARQVSLDTSALPDGAVVTDNYFDLPPGATRQITLRGPGNAGHIAVSALNAPPVRASDAPN